MSGQPYRYYTDPTKYRTMYMETMNLQADINAMNLEANKTYKETGQLPAVSQMKDQRTTSEILADGLKLKSDLVAALAKVSSQQFGQLVVQRIESHPLNIDNKLLIFTAQRIDDIIMNLKKIYKYGIKGDSNDAEQLVDFIATMYNDKNSITAQTKTFMDRQGARTFQQTASVFTNMTIFLKRLASKVLTMNADMSEAEQLFNIFDPDDLNPGHVDLTLPFRSLGQMTAEIASLIKTILGALPTDQAQATAVEEMLLNFAEMSDIRIQPSSARRGQLSTVYSGFMSTDSSEAADAADETELREDIREYLDFINTALPSIPIIVSIETQVDTFYKQFLNSIDIPIDIINSRDINEYNNSVVSSGLEKAIKNNIDKLIDVLQRMYGLLTPNAEWTEYRIRNLRTAITNIILNYRKHYQSMHTQNAPNTFQSQTSSNTSVASSSAVPSSAASVASVEPLDEDTKLELKPLKNKITELLDKYNNNSQTLDADEIKEAYDALNRIAEIVPSIDYTIDENTTDIDLVFYSLQEALKSLGMSGVGFGKGIQKRRGRPKGNGISKAKTYKEIVKANTVLDKGIHETPRFVKFGKYLVNTHRLNNEDVFALKRPSGGNIVEIPSVKVSKNLSGVIKKMVGGELPTYSDITKLSEPEKAYLHKISKKSNILDKFDIPAPSKDAKEKDIHEFEVMKGEILAGNDNKELIKKFKLHILKLSKNGTLPKREVQEILEDLFELNL